MRLLSRDGASVELHPVAPGGTLLVHGTVDAPGGRAWIFIAPCLTIAEAGQLGAWLLRAAKDELELPDRLAFVGPELVFTVEEHEYGQPRITVGFSLAAAPGWLGAEQLRTYEYPVALDLSPEYLETAAHEWDRELSAVRPA